jgi:hypothetical protein
MLFYSEKRGYGLLGESETAGIESLEQNFTNAVAKQQVKGKSRQQEL